MGNKAEPEAVCKIVSGGQTGVDRAALDLALRLGIPCGGWCPKGRIAEDGVIDSKYPLKETALPEYSQRTEWNVRDSDATLILTKGAPAGGTALTVECAIKNKKPHFIVDIMDNEFGEKVSRWLSSLSVKVLNVAGPRESLEPGVIYSQSLRALKPLFEGLARGRNS